MAAHISFYVLSSAEGKAWQVSAHKPQGRPGYVSATEGTFAVLAGGMESFSYIMFQARTEYVTVAGNMTAKNINKALDILQDKMEDNGKVEKGQSWDRI